MGLLILLVEKQGQLVTREQIIQRLWGDDVFVDTRQGINTVALHDDPGRPRLLQTVAGSGYRLLTPVIAGGKIANEPATHEIPDPSPLPSPLLASNGLKARWRFVLGVMIAVAALALTAY